MSFYTCCDWFKKLRLFVNERNLRIDVVLKASRVVEIRWFSLNEAYLGLFKFISDYLPYFEKINIFFNIIAKKFVLIYKDWSKLFVRFIRNKLNQVVHTLAQPVVYNLIEVISSWTEHKLRSILKHLWNFQPWHIIRIGIQTFNMIFKIISIYNNNTSRFMLKYFSIFFCNITRVAWGQAWTQKGAVQKASVDVNISVSLQRSHVIDHFVWYFLERIYIGMSCYPMQFIYWITYSLD